MDKEFQGKIKRISIMLLVAMAVLALLGCSSVRYVPVETIQHDSIFVKTLQVDSVYVQDSTYTNVKGDTIEKFKYKYLYKYRLLRDTMYIERVDSVQVPYPVEQPLSRWQKVKLDLGGIAIGAIGVCVIALVIVIWLKIKQRKS